MYKYFKLKIFYNKQIQSYIFSFFLCALLTVIPFFIVKYKYFPVILSKLIILFCAFIQIIVHFTYFLHLNKIQKNYWYLVSLFFILIIIFIVVFGSIWIMFNLNHHLIT